MDGDTPKFGIGVVKINVLNNLWRQCMTVVCALLRDPPTYITNSCSAEVQSCEHAQLVQYTIQYEPTCDSNNRTCSGIKVEENHNTLTNNKLHSIVVMYLVSDRLSTSRPVRP